MKTIEVKLYKFNELPEEVQDKVITNNRGINTENSDWWYFSFDTWKEVGVRIEHFDLYKMDIGISLFYSEEQTAESILSFLGDNENYEFARRYLEYKKKLDKTYENEFDEWGECEEYDDELYDANHLFQDDLKNALLSWLREEMEYCESDQAIIDTIEANDYDFDINGKIHW
jgi:hypothetical protein